ncbi:MAG TPA: response regulator, partial [Allocoleopsis sp.]
MSMVIRQLQGLKALVVDDDANSFKLVQSVLKISGIESTCASSVYEALAVYRSLRPDILIADLEMPDGD